MENKQIKKWKDVKVGDIIYVPVVWNLINDSLKPYNANFDEVTHITRSVVTDILEKNSGRYIISEKISPILVDPKESYHKDDYFEACTTEEEAIKVCHKKLLKMVFDINENIRKEHLALEKYMSGLKNYYMLYEYTK